MVGSEEEADDTMKMDEDSVPLELILLVLLMIVSVFMVDNIGGTCGCEKKGKPDWKDLSLPVSRDSRTHKRRQNHR